jgi:hypothetical protein
MLRSILAVLAGLVFAWITSSLFEFASLRAFPSPPINALDLQHIAELVAHRPVAALALVLAGWMVAALDGGLVAALVAKGRVPAIVVGIAVALFVLMKVTIIPHPLWISIAGVLLPVPAALFGAWLARGRKTVA